jgi:signal transduction histidine kinase/ActR/RegA family two-component response regulator
MLAVRVVGPCAASASPVPLSVRAWHCGEEHLVTLRPIVQPRRRDHAQTLLSPTPEPLQAGASLSAADSFEHTALLIMRQTIEVTGAASVVIFRLAPGTERLSSLAIADGTNAVATSDLTCAQGEGLAGRAALERRVIWTGNALEDRRAGTSWQEYADLLGEGRRAAMAAPLIFGGELFGVLQVGYPAMRTFRANEISEFGKLASFAATALENARLRAIAVRGARQLRLLHDVATRLTIADEPAEIARRVVIAACEVVSARAGRLWLRRDEDGPFVLATSSGPSLLEPGLRLDTHDDLLAVRAAGIALAVTDLVHAPAADTTTGWRPRAVDGVSTWLRGVRCVPLSRDGLVSGILVVDGVSADWALDDAEVLGALAAHTSVVLTNARLYAAQAAQAAENARLHEEALELGRLKSELLANVSHEIRTPMNGVLGMTGLLLESDLSGEQRDTAETIQASAEALLSLVNDLLDFSKIEAGHMNVAPIDFSPRTVVGDVVDLLAAQARPRGLDLTVAIADDVPSQANADPSRLRQILVNLVGNAIKFTDRGGVRVRLSYAPAADRSMLRVEVTDTGIGIAPDQRQHLFQAFRQVDGSPSRRHAGTGLGLAICHKLVGLMGGEIGVESALGVGSTFWFTIRLDAAEPAGQTIAPQPPAVLAGGRVPLVESPPLQQWADARGHQILVAEDNLVNQKVLVRLLQQRSHTVDAVTNGRLALEALQRQAYDLVLMDCQMPEMDGFEATALIRRQEHDERASGTPQHTPIVAVTASATSRDRERCFAAGMDDYISKPIDIVALDLVLGRWLSPSAAVRTA